MTKVLMHRGVYYFSRQLGSWRTCFGSRIHPISQCAATLLVAFLVSACGTQSLVPWQIESPISRLPITSADLCGLRPEDFAGTGESNIRRWMESRYGVPPIERPQSVGDAQDEKVLYVQGRNGEATTAFLRRGLLFRMINSNWDQTTFGQVVSSFGPPTALGRYLPAFQEAELVYFILIHYPRLGVSASASGKGASKDPAGTGGLAVRLSEGMRVNTIDCYVPADTMAQVRHNLSPSSSEGTSSASTELLPWSGFGAWVPLQ